MSQTNGKLSKKDHILKAALRLFSRQGFHATTTKEIAKESGVAEGLLFYHFGDKRQLLLQLVRSFSFAPRIAGEEERLKKLQLEDALVEYGLSYLRFLKEHSDYLMLIWSPEMIQDPEVSGEVLQLIGSIHRAGESMLASGPAGERLSPVTREAAMTMLTSSILLQFLLHSRFRGEAAWDEEASVRELVRLLLHGLQGAPKA
ncbi:hypothetical protein J31TS4_14360 [Paenibacillus sp. J31TS4]|uniref:TetR/AcrR family transcriptional regulator n=1 Tax=Paenibacillus sp. J31TS4 TaxID=2807195 RepID=UPI001B14A5F8|nr:TetR/AcrR family transcriptional regulator [Paenibacillus sp. J31TS4]GIP38156.1 hypothetical protein J31TS4_14360 [Paenibacillus sp. J31TS4]